MTNDMLFLCSVRLTRYGINYKIREQLRQTLSFVYVVTEMYGNI